ncbi:MAG: DNA packaging Nu1 [Alcaligenaceae bacterium]|nr:DNA packaging Nu1 [Alcaligenaceae bacterium SAGV5]MPS51252.1 DNA packaging Nu1 [Alcaligenaceae bacterium SAGV3]MPT57251.1 DNA packaging Nu1 [Alcaligenaceae bacterium]
MLELNQPLTQEKFASLVGVSQQAISAMQAKGVLLPGASASVWLKAYCDHLREQAAGRQSEGKFDLIQERARLAREQADRVAMENAVSRQELAPVVLLSQVLASVGRKVAGILDTIPVQLKRRTTGMTKADLDFVEAEITRARNIAAAVELNWDELDAMDGADTEGDPDGPEVTRGT